jgi:hypothetical protein
MLKWYFVWAASGGRPWQSLYGRWVRGALAARGVTIAVSLATILRDLRLLWCICAERFARAAR